MKKILSIILYSILLLSCNSQSVGLTENKVMKEKTLVNNGNYDKINEKYSDKLILTAFLCINGQISDKFNGKKYKYVDLQLIDSLTNLPNIKILTIDKINQLDNLGLFKVAKWCETYIVFDYIFSNLRENLYLENIILNIKSFKEVLNKYLYPSQTIDSLSFSQSQMIFYDFINFLVEQGNEKTKSVLEDCFKYLK
ncbi:MAG: hypothetical protein ABI207_02975 [Crocinitomicaceae bacterium]